MSSKGKQKKLSRQAAAKKRAGELSNASSSSSAAPPTVPQLTFEEAIDQVEQLIEQSDLDAAEQALRSHMLLGNSKPSDIGPQHAQFVSAMELLAQPDGGAEKWMYYGQLIGGREALDAFKRGINCMFKLRAQIQEAQGQAAARQAANTFTMGEFDSPEELNYQMANINKQISSGYACMAELYVTDLCDDEGAEVECEKLLGLAIQSFPENPDALYALANLRTIQQRIPEACEVMTKLFAVLVACRANSIENMSILQLADDQKNEALPATINMADVSYELRVSIAKLALELQAFEPALGLLDQLLEEDDRILEVSHLAAVCAFHMGQFATAMEHIERAEGFLATEENAGMLGEEDDEDGQRVAMEQEEIDITKRALAELKGHVTEALKNAPPEPEGDGDDAEEDGAGEEEKDGNGEAMEDVQNTSMTDD